MKLLVLITAFTLSTTWANAQVKSKATNKVKSNTSADSTNKTTKSKVSKSKRSNLPPGTAIHGGKVVTLHHGKHDYTPGSPVGTGGAGGSTLSGSPQGSTSENAMGKKASNELLKKDNGTKSNNKKSDKKTD